MLHCVAFRFNSVETSTLIGSFLEMMNQFRGIHTKPLADGTVQLRLGDKRGTWMKIRCRRLEDHWQPLAAAAAAPQTPAEGGTSAEKPPVLVQWRAKILTHVRQSIRRIEKNAAEWGYPLEEFPVLEELKDLEHDLRTDPSLDPFDAHCVIRKAKITLYMAELSDDSD